MIAKELNFERTTGSFKTIVLIDDDDTFVTNFNNHTAGSSFTGVESTVTGWTYPYTRFTDIISHSINEMCGSDLWHSIRFFLNIGNMEVNANYGFDLYKFLYHLFPKSYKINRGVTLGDLTEPVKFNNNTLSSTYHIGVRDQNNDTRCYFGIGEQAYQTCLGGGHELKLTEVYTQYQTGNSCLFDLYFNIYPSSVLNEDGTISLGNANYVYQVSITYQIAQPPADHIYYRTAFFKRVNYASQMGDVGRFNDIEASDHSTDPYSDGGSAQPGGGTGTFDITGDAIPAPGLPSISALSTGFVSLWKPSASEMESLHNYLWSSAFDINTFKKIFANPIDVIMGFGILPFSPTIAGVKNLKIGNIDTGLTFNYITQQYYKIDCGTIYLKEIFGSYLDYEPYTSIDVFLPFIGVVKLSADDFIRHNADYENGGKMAIEYNIDILNGACVACLSCYDAKGNTTVCYEYNGNVLTQLPITGSNYTSMFNSLLSIAGNIVSGGFSAASGNAAGVLNDAVNAAHNVTSAKPTIQHGGSLSSSCGLLGNRKPFIIRNIPDNATATFQNLYSGYPSHVTKSLNDLTGYTEMECVYVDNIPATDGELKEIETILKTGVFL